MKRSSLLFVCCAIVVGFVSCGKAPKPCDPDTLSDKPQLCPDRDSLGFAQEFGSGTIIGQKPIESLSIRNGGLADLVIQTVSTAGDNAFSYSSSWDPAGALTTTTVKGNKTVFIQVAFAPTQPKGYTGTLNIVSNADTNLISSPNKTFTVSGCGIPPDSMRMCNPDGGAIPDGGVGCGDPNQRCNPSGLYGVCLGVSVCYRDGGVTP
jgi:hypothetical protein